MDFVGDWKIDKLMNNIGKITDADFDIKEKVNTEKMAVKLSARGIIFNDNGEIGVVFKSKKNEYRLPGGIIKENENPKTAFIRECEEELGSKIEIIEDFGTIEEFKSQENMAELSYVYVGKELEELNPKPTRSEIDEGFEIEWLVGFDAIKFMQESLKTLKASKYSNLYNSRFGVFRDIKILKYFLNKNNLK